jgi:hypothetical protein
MSSVNQDFQRKEKLEKAREKFRVKAKHEESDTSWMTGSIVILLHFLSAAAPIYAIYQRFEDKSPAFLYGAVALATGFWVIIELMKSKYLEKYLIAVFASEDSSLPEDDIVKAMHSAGHNRNWVFGVIIVDVCLGLWAWQATVKPPTVQPQAMEQTIVNAYKLAEDRYASAVVNGNSSRWLTTFRNERDSAKTVFENEKSRVNIANISLHRKGAEQKMQLMIAPFLWSCAIGLGLYLVRKKHESNQYERLKSALETDNGATANTTAKAATGDGNGGVMERLARSNEILQKQVKEQGEVTKKLMEELKKRDDDKSDFENLRKELESMKAASQNGASRNGAGK